VVPCLCNSLMKFSTASQALVSMKFTESASRSNQVRMSAFHVRRDKAALFQWVQAPPGDRSPAGSDRSRHGGDEVSEAFG